jgi:hypothetical protein
MGDFKKTLIKHGLRLMSDPRVIKLMQDERLIKAVMGAISVPGKAQSFAKERFEGVVKAMALATEAEVKDLRRTVRKLEDDMAALRGERDAAAGNGRRKNTAA